MFTLKRNLFYILFFSFFFITIQSAYSYVADTYNGRVKYGTYICNKDGATCNFERYEGGASFYGAACPPFVRGMKFEERNNIMADFLNSKYCKFTPTKVKKYNCKYDVGSATVYMKEGKVISASHSNNINKTNLQEFYQPNKCTESKMEGDNGEPPLKSNHPNNSSNYTPPNKYNADATTAKNAFEQYKGTESFNVNISSLQNEIESLKNEIESLKNKNEPSKNEIESLRNEISFLKNQNHSLEMYSHYQSAFLAIFFILLLIALTKSNKDPYNRL